MTDQDPQWRKPSSTPTESDYVEVADTGDEIVVRDSRDPNGVTLRFTRAEMKAFILGVKAGEFDDLTR